MTIERFTGKVAGAALVAGLCLAGTARAAETISVVTFGGAYEAAATKAYFEPFTKETGVGFAKEAYDGGLAKLSAMVEAKNTTWDLIDLESNDAITGCDEGLLQKLDLSALGDTSDFIPGSITPCAIATMVWSTVFAYDSTKLATAPKSIADFFDTKTFPGKRGLRKSPKATLEWALLADGVPAAEVYKVLGTPEGVDRAFKKLDTIKKDIVWWEAGAQAPQLLADGAVVMTQAYNGRISNAVKEQGKPFVTVWDGQVYDFEWWGVPTGAKNGDAAKKFIAFQAKPEILSQLAKYIAYAPPRTKAVDLIDAETLKGMPTAPANFGNAVQIDVPFWTDNFDALNKRFTAWLAQ
ncbi:ABC transporter substrate-binding protein [Zavarzinia sp.]|uniref:ABC transporter substrate-binding protein n=1 Tax=Zavarzinia sp. TaxID=2027920 RepID=UPI003568E693